MPRIKRGSERREDALSQARIVEAAIELLDEAGETGLTFRALATRLSTGPGALYWHIASKDELLVAASNAVVSRALGEEAAIAAPQQALRTLAARVFDAIDAHPWLGSQLYRAPWETAMLQIFERIGQQVQALGVSGDARFTSASALLSYILGVSIQNAANARLLAVPVPRADFLDSVAERWKQLDERAYPFLRGIVGQLREHDDRVEFLAGLELILTGIAAPR